jgi:hypothetical protein
MLFQASRAVTASSEMSRFISVSEYAPPSTSLIIPACIETLGANSGASHLFSDNDADQRPAEEIQLRLLGA